MKLIWKLDSRNTPSTTRKTGRWTRWALFQCPICKDLVERIFTTGTRNKTCGCIKRSQAHSDRGTKIYRTWIHMNERCNNTNDQRYHRYGGRGITICNDWKQYKVFREWALTNGYSAVLELDRRDNDGNYEPSNCRFVTSAQNSRNRSSTKLSWFYVNMMRAIYESGTISLSKLGDMFGVSKSTTNHVILHNTWNP